MLLAYKNCLFFWGGEGAVEILVKICKVLNFYRIFSLYVCLHYL